MWHDEVSHLTCWTKQSDGRKEKEKEKEEREGKGREEGGERSSTLSLDFPEIRSSAFIGVRDKVDPHNERYVWVPKLWSFDKLQEVGDFPTRYYF